MQYTQCVRCIMDNVGDDTIKFDEQKQCNYCSSALELKKRIYFPNEAGENKLKALIQRLKNENEDKLYDCIMGISGGLDSSYLAYLGSVKWGLRILAVHIDDGFDTEISSRNIERISKFPNFDLKIIKPDPEQFADLTRAYMKAGVPNLATPQDNVLFASLYDFMRKNKIRTFLSGGNFALECILVRDNTHDAYDLRNLIYIHKKFGTKPINKLNLISQLRRDIDNYLLKIESLRPLNLINYNMKEAWKELTSYCGFEYYGGKHLENYLTKFIQQYWFYKKFNVDKRKSHLSSMIISDQLSRDEALELYKKPLYNEEDMKATINFVLKKLNMSNEEFEDLLNAPSYQHSDYPTSLYIKIRTIFKQFVK